MTPQPGDWVKISLGSKRGVNGWEKELSADIAVVISVDPVNSVAMLFVADDFEDR